MTTRSLLLVCSVLANLAGCAGTTQPIGRAGAPVSTTILLVFDDGTPTNYYVCQVGNAESCELKGSATAADFQREGIQNIVLPQGCVGAFRMIRIDDAGSAQPKAHVVCAQAE